MEYATVRELRVLLPDLDAEDLEPFSLVGEPDDELAEVLVDGGGRPGLRLGYARIGGSHLRGVDLSEGVIRAGELYGSLLERVDLSGATMSGTTIERCRFLGCRMTGARLAELTLKNVVFDGCRLDYVTMEALRATGPVAFVDCILTDAVLTGCRLPAVAFSGCGFSGVELGGCDLRGADLRDNDLVGLSGLDSLRGVVVDGEQLNALTMVAVRDLAISVR